MPHAKSAHLERFLRLVGSSKVRGDLLDQLYSYPTNFICSSHKLERFSYSTVTDLARLRGLSTSVPRATAV